MKKRAAGPAETRPAEELAAEAAETADGAPASAGKRTPVHIAASERSAGRPRVGRLVDRGQVPPLLADVAGWCWRLLIIGLAIYVLGRIALRLELVVLPLAIALLVTAILSPVNQALRKLKLPRSVAAILTVMLALAALAGVIAFVVDRATAQYPEFVDQIDKLIAKAQRWAEGRPLHLKHSAVQNWGNQIVDALRQHQSAIVSGAVTFGAAALEVVTAAVLTLFLVIFLLYDGEGIWGWTVRLFPPQQRQRIDGMGRRVWKTASAYAAGTFTVAAFHALVMGLTLAILGVPLVAPLAVLMFLGSFVPLIGAVVAGAIVCLVALITKGLGAAVIVLIVLIVENQAEGHLLQPLVVGRYVRLHPLAIALVLTAGTIVAGLPGAIFAVPIAASINAGARYLAGIEDERGRPTTPPPKRHVRHPRQRSKSRASRQVN